MYVYRPSNPKIEILKRFLVEIDVFPDNDAMTLKKFSFLFLASILFLTAVFLTLRPRLPEWERQFLEWAANKAAYEYFEGSLRLEKAGVDRHMKLSVTNIRAQLKTREGSVPFQIESLISEEPLTHFARNLPVRFRFQGLRTAASQYEGAEGLLTVLGGKDGYVDFRSEVKSLGLEDLTWLNPDNLEGSTGRMTGHMTFRSDARQDPALGMELLIQEPGGRIQAQFFDLLLPYLPEFKNVDKIKTLASQKSLVKYKNAALIVTLKESDKMKVFLHIMIPDYNISLNLNLEIRTDKKNAFMEIAQLLGLFEVAVR